MPTPTTETVILCGRTRAGAERDERGADNGIEGATDRGPAEEVARPRDDDRVSGQPGQRHRREHRAEHEQGEKRRSLAGCELGKQRREEDGDLRVADVAQEALPRRLERRQRARAAADLGPRRG